MKKLMIATILTVTTGVAVVQPAFADYDPVGSALIGGVAGAVIGHAVGGRNGAAVGAAIGGVSGAVIASSQPRSYYERTVYQRPVQTTYYAAPAPVTYYRTAYYPVRQVAYYGDDDRGYYHDRGWHRDWHDRDWRGEGWHDRDRDWHDRGYYSY